MGWSRLNTGRGKLSGVSTNESQHNQSFDPSHGESARSAPFNGLTLKSSIEIWPPQTLFEELEHPIGECVFILTLFGGVPYERNKGSSSYQCFTLNPIDEHARKGQAKHASETCGREHDAR